MEKGIEKTKADIALQMLSKDTPMDFIIEVTGLTETEVFTLKTRLR